MRELFKDEVRVLGRELGLPEIFVGRHPFPGPGLAIRCPGDITPEKLEILRNADAVYITDSKSRAIRPDLAGVRSAAAGENRRRDGRRPHLRIRRGPARGDLDRRHDRGFLFLRHESSAKTATRIINEVKGVNRVVYDITSKPPGTIEWE